MTENRPKPDGRFLEIPPQVEWAGSTEYFDLFNGIPIACAILSIPDLKIVAANDRFISGGETSREEVIGSSILNLEWKDRVGVGKTFQTLLEQGMIQNVELEVYSQSGKLNIISLYGKRITLGDRDCLLTGTVNVTQSKRAEEALEDSDRRFRGFADILPVVTFETNLNGEVVYFNQLAQDLFGYPDIEILGQPIVNFMAPEDRERATNSLKRTLTAGERLENEEFTMIKQDGSRLSVIIQAAPIRNNRDKITGIRGITVNFSSQKIIENELRESEAFSTGLFMNSPNPIVVVNPDHTIRTVNPAFEKLTGFNRTEVIGLTDPYPWWPPEKYQDYKEHGIHIENPDDSVRERYYRKKNGEIFWVVLNVKRFVEKGQPKYSISDWVNITERKKAEEQLKYQAMLVDNVSDAIISTIMDGGIISWNKAAEKVYGWKQEEVIGKNIYDLLQIIQLTRRSPLKTVDSYNKTGFWTGVSAHQRRDGVILDISSSICMIRDPSGKPIGSVGIFRDITEEKKAEEKLVRSERKLRENDERFQQIALNAGEWIWEIDENGTYLYSNPVVKDILGYTPDELVGKVKFFDLFPEEFRTSIASRILTDDIRSPVREFIHQCVHKSGKHIILEANIVPVNNQNGDTIGARGVSTDITERKQAAEKLEELYQKEKKEREELQEEARTRGMFIDVLAHELRTPLTPILASTGMLKDIMGSKSTDIRSKLTDNIFNSTQTLARRLEELLDLARYSRGTFKLNIQPTDLNKFLNEVITRFKPSLSQKRQQLIEQVPERLPEAEIDGSRLEQVIINLLSNASKFSQDEGTILFRVTLEDHQFQVDIKDNGIGIPLDSQGRLFQPYHRVEQDRQQFSGLGLGLAVAKQIVEAHGGKIWLVSQPGQGSTFSFCIPLHQQTATQ